MKLEDLPKRYQDQINAQINNRTTNPASNVEQAPVNEPDGSNAITSFDSPVRVSFHSVRKKLADIDGISGKAALDGIVESGVLQDDSPAFVESVTHTQSKASKGESEYTVIIIENFDK